MRINNNITAENANRQLGISARHKSSTTERLSSGMRVNRAADDAAGLAISEKMRTQIRGLNRASLNIQDGASLLQVGDGALQAVHDKMQRLRELAVQAANDTNELIDREMIQLEFGQLTSEVNSVVSRTNFNGRLLFDGSIGAPFEYNLGRITAPFMTTISAEADFDSPVNVPGWSAPPTFGRIAIGQNFFDPGFQFPNGGVFAMQIVTPADGIISVVLDFAELYDAGEPITTHTEFLNFFADEFNRLAVEYGLGGPLVEGIRFEPGPPTIVFDFPRVEDLNRPDRHILTGVMGRPGSTAAAHRPRVHIGLGGPTPSTTNIDQINSLNRIPTAPGGLFPGPFISNRPPSADPLTGDSFVNDRILGGPPFEDGFATPGIGLRADPPTNNVFPNITITIDGRPTTINFAPGSFDSIEAFVAANQEAFENAIPRGNFELSAEDGQLVITARSSTDGTPPTVTFVINPSDLATNLGFGSMPPNAVDTQPAPGDALWIQSGANRGDGIEIAIPRLCTRSLGLSIRRPDDVPDEDTGEIPSGLTHFNDLGADGYTQTANVEGDPMEHSLDVTSHESAAAALSVLTNAVNIISTERARMGAKQNRLDHARGNVDNTSENLQASESRIRDADMAAEMTELVRLQILNQSGTSMLAHANALPQGVLQLLG